MAWGSFTNWYLKWVPCACNEHEYESTQWTYHSGIVERGHSDICMSLPCPYTVVVALQVASSIGEAKELHGQIS